MLPWMIAAAVAFWGSALGGAFYFARRYVRALERRVADESEIAALRERVAQLEAKQASTDHLLAGQSHGLGLNDEEREPIPSKDLYSQG